MGVLCKVRSKDSTTVTFDPPLPFDYSSLVPATIATAISYTFKQEVGIEDLTFDMTGVRCFSAVQWQQVWGSWLYQVEIVGAGSRDVYMSSAICCEVRRC